MTRKRPNGLVPGAPPPDGVPDGGQGADEPDVREAETPEEVNIEDFMSDEVEDEFSLGPPTFQQRAGLRLATWVFWLIATLTLLLVFAFVLLLISSADKTVSDRVREMFQIVVSNTLLPVFTTIVGYLLGTSRQGNGDKP